MTPRDEKLDDPDSPVHPKARDTVFVSGTPNSAIRRSTFGEPKNSMRGSMNSIEEFPELFQRRKKSRMMFDDYDRREQYLESQNSEQDL